MYKQNDKLTVAGLQSFTKGCSIFTYSSFPTRAVLIQESQNPSVYTKLSCYFRWIAEQYNMEYEANDNIDPDCLNYTGDINEVTANDCRAIHTNFRLGNAEEFTEIMSQYWENPEEGKKAMEDADAL